MNIVDIGRYVIDYLVTCVVGLKEIYCQSCGENLTAGMASILECDDLPRGGTYCGRSKCIDEALSHVNASFDLSFVPGDWMEIQKRVRRKEITNYSRLERLGTIVGTIESRVEE